MEWRLYLRQIPGLWAGRKVPVFDINREPPDGISNCDEDELRLLIAVADRQLDALSAQLEQIRQRAQFMFTTLLVLTGLAAAVLRSIVDTSSLLAFVLWCLSSLVVLLAMLGAAAIIVNRKEMGTVDAAWITRQAKPWLLATAVDTIDSVHYSWTTVASQLTFLRDTALLTIAGTLGICVSWIATLY